MASPKAHDQSGGLGLDKDESLDQLANDFNVAQFISYDDSLSRRYSRLRGVTPNCGLSSLENDIEYLFSVSCDHRINIRTFRSGQNHGTPFIYDIRTMTDALSQLRRLTIDDGWCVIANETLDVHDGSLSGVYSSDLLELVADDTPRGVEKSDSASFDATIGRQLISLLFDVDLPLERFGDLRVEFSVHHNPVGWRSNKWVIWEARAVSPPPRASLTWPNSVSRLVGDKAFGLLIGYLLGAPVPFTRLFGRRLPPVSFGEQTLSGEGWLRTAPTVATPGKYSTYFGWKDPFALLAGEDPAGTAIASVLWQQSVPAVYSGAASAVADTFLEGVHGFGDSFMLGVDSPIALPALIADDVRALLVQLQNQLGPIRAEWSHDGKRAWLIQLHTERQDGATQLVRSGGEAKDFIRFDPRHGIHEFQRIATIAQRKGKGVQLTRRVGMMSHLGEIARDLQIPLKVPSAPSETPET